MPCSRRGGPCGGLRSFSLLPSARFPIKVSSDFHSLQQTVPRQTLSLVPHPVDYSFQLVVASYFGLREVQ